MACQREEQRTRPADAVPVFGCRPGRCTHEDSGGFHAHIARELLPYGEAGATLRQLSANGYASTEKCKVELATGTAGTVYLCHPFLVHAAQPHRGQRPRFMAQPALLPKGEFDPALPPSPVQVAIRQAIGMTA